MPPDKKFKFQCHSCSAQLGARNKHAGRSVECPKCGAELIVPTVQPTPPPDVSDGQWYMRDQNGEVFGPCSKSELDLWAKSGAMNVQCSIREGQRPWLPATQAYPDVAYVRPANGKQTINSTALSPIIAVLLSFVIIGLPQLLMGQVGKGIVILCGGVLFAVITGIGAPFVWAFAAVDAYKIASKIENGQAVSEWEFF